MAIEMYAAYLYYVEGSAHLDQRIVTPGLVAVPVTEVFACALFCSSK